jgi:hypothetical protein
LPSSNRDPDALDKAIEAATLDLSPYYEGDSVLDQRESQELETMAQSVADGYTPQGGEPGGCWLWLLDNTHSLTRALLRNDKVRVSVARRYLVDYFSGVGRGLQQREEMTKELADRVRRKWGIECGYFSVLGSSDPDAVPFYCGDNLENSMFYNHSSTGSSTVV